MIASNIEVYETFATFAGILSIFDNHFGEMQILNSSFIRNSADDYLIDILYSKLLMENCTFQNIDFTQESIPWEDFRFFNTTFLGCQIGEKDLITLTKKEVLIIPDYNHLPYNPYRHALYTWQELEEKDKEQQKEIVAIEIINFLHLFKKLFKSLIAIINEDIIFAIIIAVEGHA